MRTLIVFDGESSRDHNLVVERRPDNVHAARRWETVTIPGRNGKLTLDGGSYENYTQSYEIYLDGKHDGLPDVASDVAEWLSSSAGYKKLEDLYEPDVYRLAQYRGSLQLSNILNTFGKATISFDVQPQRYLKHADNLYGVQVLPGQNNWLYNKTNFNANPKIIVSTSPSSGADGVITIVHDGNTETITLTGIDSGTIIDSELLDCYYGSTNYNSAMSGDFPIFEPGSTNITVSGDITSLTIFPRWWKL